MLHYCPCVTQLSHINHCIEPRELLHLKAHMRKRGKGGKGKGVVEVVEPWIKGECHGIRPSDSSAASIQRGAGALKLKLEHNSWRCPQEVDVSSQAGYWPL